MQSNSVVNRRKPSEDQIKHHEDRPESIRWDRFGTAKIEGDRVRWGPYTAAFGGLSENLGQGNGDGLRSKHGVAAV